MIIRRIQTYSILVSIAVGFALNLDADAQKRNVVFILIDDQRFDAFSFMGHPFLETPNIDQLAKDGLVFENAFVTTSLCSPSRATILTGLYAHKHGVLDNDTRLPERLPTFPKALQSAGYETAFTGKWHMGNATDEPRPGWDHWASFRGQGPYFNPTFNVDGERREIEGYTTDIITDFAEAFVRRDHSKPFFLYMSHKAVHSNFAPAPRHDGVYADEDFPHPKSMANTDENYAGKPEWVRAQRNSWHGVDGMYNDAVDFDQFARDYAETLLAVDDSVGRIVQALKDQGLFESTLIVYTSDNGFLFGEHGHIDKRSMYEPSIRVPLIVHCPELVDGGQKRKEMIVNCDFAPTFMEMAGVEIPESIQGRSFYPMIRGEKMPWRDAFLYTYFWERPFPQTPTVIGVRGDRYKFMRYHGIWDRYELYDIVNDPGETNNLLADIVLTTEISLDYLIRTRATGETKEAYDMLNDRMNTLVEELEIRPEPSWAY